MTMYSIVDIISKQTYENSTYTLDHADTSQGREYVVIRRCAWCKSKHPGRSNLTSDCGGVRIGNNLSEVTLALLGGRIRIMFWRNYPHGKMYDECELTP